MKLLNQLLQISLLQALFLLSFTNAYSSNALDTCAVNDVCENATIIDFVYPGEPFTCLDGCNLNALPSMIGNACQMELYSTVWYKVPVYNWANVMNVNVHSDDFENPMLAMYYGYPGCSLLFPIHLTNNNNTCVVGSDGMVEAVGINIEESDNIFIAVSSLYSLGGTFSICINTITQDSMCVLKRNLEVIQRSEGGPLEGPFSAGEKISMCFTVEKYTAIGNGCQWFQGLVPVFGNGWDPSSFDNLGEPHNSSINEYHMGQAGNGVYGAATWNWFNNVGYHHTSPWLEVGDHDGDGQIEMCNSNYEINCVNTGGIQAGCCGPCWDDPGVTLPPGWFAYGINGTCPTPGPPIAVDWGDGNTCGCCMGPWKFCFDLVVRSFPDCLDSSYSDLSVAFYTFADGEIGAWAGAASVCALDHPLKMDFSLDCIKHADLGTEYLRNHCSKDTFEYVINEPGIRNWIWSVSPAWPVDIPVQSGDNGFKIVAPLLNPFEKEQQVTYLFIGQEENSIHKVVKRVKFNLYPDIVSVVEDNLEVCKNSNKPVLITPEFISGGNPPYFFSWNSSTDTSNVLTLYPPFENGILDFSISDGAGCINDHTIEIKTIHCLPEISISTDQSNDKPTKIDPPPFGSRLQLQPRQSNEDNLFKVYPIPSRDKVILEWPSENHQEGDLNIYDTHGTLVKMLKIDPRIEPKIELDITHFAPGVYFINLISNNKIYTARLVKI